jgi:hypothetical protein
VYTLDGCKVRAFDLADPLVAGDALASVVPVP